MIERDPSGSGARTRPFRWLPRSLQFFLVVVFAVGSAGITARYINRGSDESLENIEAPEAYEVEARGVGSLLETKVFREELLRANGGYRALARLLSLQFNGTLLKDGSEMEFLTLKRRPNQMLLTYRLEGTKLTYGVTGGVVWQRNRPINGSELVGLVEPPLSDELMASAAFFEPLLEWALDGQLEALRVESGSRDGELVLVVKLLGASPMEFLVDPTSMTTKVQFEALEGGRILRKEFSDYQVVGGLQQPKLTKTYLDESLISEIRITGMRANVGVDRSLFERPDGVVAE